MSAERYESPDPHRNVRYGPWRGGPDPLAAPYDVRAAVDQIGSDVMSAGNVRDSLRDLMRRGVDGRGGLDKLAQKLRKLRAAARRRGDLGGTLDQVRAALDQALAFEREALAATEGDEARMAEMELDTLPDDVAGAVRALDGYDWTSPEAKATYEAIQDMLRREVLDAQFAGMKQALESPDPEAMARVKDMLADLNALLAAHARQEDTTDQFADFMAKHGEFFPEQPENVDELIDALARRQAAAQRMMASLSPEQREQLGQLMSQALGDADLASEMAQLSDNLRALRPGLDRESPSGMRPGGECLGYSEAVEAVAELADLEALENQLAQGYPGATLDDVDVDTLEKRLGHEALRDFQGLRDLERELEEQGFLTRTDDGLRLTPRAVRRLGQTALKRVFAQIAAAGHGDHEDHRTGAADEPTGLTRPWEFGDELPLDAPRTVANALRRAGLPDASGDRAGVQLDVEDFEVTETERRTSAAVALCVDLSYSMFADGRWGPMKQTALALQHLIETRFRQDALQVIGFNRTAQRLSPVELAEIEPTMLQGTNLQHALLIASRHLRRHPDAEPVVLVVTDGEPTAHLTGDGGAYFRWPTTTETLRATIAQVDELGRYGATLNTFMLGDDEGLARFVDAIARRAGGRVFTPDIGRLGEYVVSDYLKARRGRR
ncbi:VWA domain-containing protein [uncultured Friedmanniella sp.]|uniref:vWA domain-containing protein n=1 Tax=uncultured Friedmanniella sp. TaxID=335381 RepID=UPI0035CB22B5